MRYLFKGKTFQRYVGGDVRQGTVELNIDWDKLIEKIGAKAAFNKSGKSGLAYYGVKAKFIPTKEAP